MDYIFNMIYLLNLILVIWCTGFKKYIQKGINKLDLMISLVFVLDHVFAIIFSLNPVTDQNDLVNISQSVKQFRLLLTFYKQKRFKAIRMITKSFFKTIDSISITLTIIVYIYIISMLISVELFSQSGQIRLLQTGSAQPRLNFDTMGDAFLACFVLFFSQGWPAWMQEWYAVSKGDAIAFYFIFALIG